MNASTGCIAIGGLLILAGIARVIYQMSTVGWQANKTGIVLIGMGAALVIAGAVT